MTERHCDRETEGVREKTNIEADRTTNSELKTEIQKEGGQADSDRESERQRNRKTDGQSHE